METAILIHGCHLQAKDWENIIWGYPEKGIFGRVPKGLQVAQQEDARLVYFGTGASEKEGIKEAQYTYDYCMDMSRHWYSFSKDPFQLGKKIKERTFIDTESQTTPQEVARCIEMCKERGIEKLILVSSPTHIARCLQSAEKIRAEGDFKGLQIVATASDTCFVDSTPADVLIVEPSHRGDRAVISLHKTLKLAMFARKLPDEQALEFNADLVAFLEEQKKKYLG